jgi:hypothetical protein
MKHPPERDWMIVAPWWQWIDPNTVPPGQLVVPDPQKGRLSRPILQKYDSPNLVNDFIADPQRCLRFVNDDLVHSLQAAPAPSQNLLGKLFRIGARKLPDGTVIDQQYVPDGSNTRKIFLSTHKRFYLVVCGIHCDGPGFPKVARDKVCKAGFVIRRRTVTAPSCGVDEVKPIVKNLAEGRSRLARVNQLAEIEIVALSAATGQGDGDWAGFKSAKLESLVKARASLQALVSSERARFDDWVKRFGVVPQLQGWFTSPQGLDKVGCWGHVDETPTELGLESSFSLYALIPNKNNPVHAGQFGTVYFGVLPTSSHDCDRSGQARFDDREYYEVRCWVQRHLVPHDPDRPCPCPDGIFWSVPTRPYKLAPHFDLVGTGNQPVTIQLPDLNALAAQAKPSLGVGFAKPPGSLMISGDKDGKPQKAGRSSKFEICFIPIPLITIVATFVFELFLPVVMFIFQLWWMLALKFCIPPELDVAAGITAEIGIDADINVDASIEASINIGDLAAKLQQGFGPDAAAALQNTYSPVALANMDFNVSGAANPANPNSPSAIVAVDHQNEVTHA